MKTLIQKDTYSHMFLLHALSTAYNNWVMEATQVPTNWQMDKDVAYTDTHTHTHTPQNKILPFVVMQMDLEDLIFSEICQTEENNTVR